MNAALDRYWWTGEADPDGEKGTPRHQKIFRVVEDLERTQRVLRDGYAKYNYLYDASDIQGTDALSSKTPVPIDAGPVTENVVQVVVDALKAKISKSKPKATFLTDGGDFSLQRRAKQLERFIEAEFSRTRVYDEMQRVFRDACVFGTGVLAVFDDNGRIGIQRVLIDEIIVDERSCRDGKPYEVHRRCIVDRELLKADFPDKAEMIDKAEQPKMTWANSRRLAPNEVVVIVSHRRPSRPGRSDGRYSMSVSTGLLEDRPYTKDHFPYVFLRFEERTTGFYGRGVPEVLAGKQRRINKHNWTISKVLDHFGIPFWALSALDAKLAPQMRPEMGKVLLFKGSEPKLMVPEPVPEQVIQDKAAQKASAFEDTGVSQLSAQSKKPAGLDSGAALMAYDDIETERFSLQAQDYEQSFLDVARLFVEFASEIYAGTKKYKASWANRKSIRALDWGKVKLDDDLYVMSIEASSILSRTPAGRLQGAINLVQAGMLKPEAALRLLGHPDLEHEIDILTAALEDIEATIEDILDGVFRSPEPLQNLALGVERVQLAYLKTRRMANVPESVLEDLRTWIQMAVAMLPQAQGAPGPGQAMVAAPQAGLAAPAGPSAVPGAGLPMPGGPPAMGAPPPM